MTELIKAAQELAALLLKRKKTIALAESCTGGMIAAALVSCPGVSQVLLEGCVCYSNAAKMRTLGVSRETLEAYGAVSEQCAQEMAEGIRSYAGSDCAIAVTGIAGPGGGTEEKPVGTVYIAVQLGENCRVERSSFSGDRAQVRTQSAIRAIKMLQELIEKEEGE